MFNKAVKPLTECYSSFTITFKTMLIDVVSRAAVDFCLLLKMLNDTPQPVKEAVGQATCLVVVPSPKNVDKRRKESRMASPPQVVVPRKCHSCQQPEHISTSCPLKTDPNPMTEALLLFESFNFDPHQLVASINSGAEINVFTAYMIDAYVNVGIDVRKFSRMVVSGVCKKEVAAFANFLIYSVATQKAVAVNVFFVHEIIDELTTHVFDEKNKLLDDLNEFMFDGSYDKLSYIRKYDKNIDYLQPKVVVLPNKMIYFLPKGKHSLTYLVRKLVATLSSHINVILHEDMKYYVFVDHCHYKYHKDYLNEALKEVPNLFSNPLEHDGNTLKLLDHDHENVDDDAFLNNQRELFDNGHQSEPYNIADSLAKDKPIDKMLKSIKEHKEPDKYFPKVEKNVVTST
uniref:Integrase, catalytic region, zinc finger, CCHC-type, peptidase aspartic, catalytic n=1 Tax=Strongyloides venezuelensis TaxID=75913 RepID=A0A0K0FW38_STRVS